MNKRSRSEFSAPARRGAAIGAAYNRYAGRGLYGRGLYGRGMYSGSGLYGRGLYSGRGGYNFKKASRGWRHSKVGKALAGVAKTAAMDAVARVSPEAAAGIQTLSGRGLYSGRGAYTNTNSLIEGGRPSMSVSSGAKDNQEMIITHTEYLQDVYGPADAAFRNETLSINPGLWANFPWLSQIAANYEEYEFVQLMFEYRSTVDVSATSNSNGATGTIIMATNYNPDAKSFVNKETMMQYHGAMSGRVTENLHHGVECEPSKNAGTSTKYVRTLLPIGQSLKDFDLGTFQYAIVNAPSAFKNAQIGELWVSYQVRVQKPRLYTSVFRNLPYDLFLSSSTGDVTKTNPFGADGALVGAQNSLGIKIATSYVEDHQTKFVLTFPDFLTGTFEILLNLRVDLNSAVQGPTFWTDNSFICGGGMSFVNDMYQSIAGNDNDVDNTNGPFGFKVETTAGFDQGSNILTNSNLVVHVSVVPSTDGVDNTVEWILNYGAGSTSTANQADVLGTMMTIKPYNPMNTTILDSNGVMVYNQTAVLTKSG